MPRGILALRAYQVGDTMHQHPGLAGAGAREHQDVRLLPVVRHDAALDGILETFDDGPPRFRRGLPRSLLAPIRQPPAQKVLLAKAEIVHSQPQGVSHGPEALLREFRHHVDLEHLFVVVEPEGFKVGLGEAASFRLEADGHGRPEHRQPPVQPNDLLLVEPQQGAIHQLTGTTNLAHQYHVGLDRRHQLAEGRLRQQVRAPASPRQTGEQMGQQTAGGYPSQLGSLFQCTPLASQRHLHGLRIPPPHPKASPIATLAAPIGGDAADDPGQAFRQGIGMTVVLEPLGGHA